MRWRAEVNKHFGVESELDPRRGRLLNMSSVVTRKAKAGAVKKKASPKQSEPVARAEDRNLDQHIGLVLREKRQAQSLTIADVASLAGVSRGMLSKIENGQVSTSLETLHRISDALGMTLAQWFKNFDVPTG
ncbi:MAG TPA: helix-turn-helix transcriptional regulator, partial [Thioalkalivibrio sp.]|nr:helix-turn-helix transcriptional regulator [Thioalkalivibrio sp.]